MGRLSFHKHEITHKSKKMKLFAALAAAAAAQQAGTPVMPMMPAMPAMPAMGGMNPLMMMSLLGDDSGMDSDLMMLMMMSGQGGMGQMNPLMLSMLLDSDSTRDYDRTKLEQICADAGVDCTAHFADIFQPIETTKIIDCAGATDAAACTTAMEDAYDAIMKNKKSDMSDLLLLSMMGGQGMGNMNSMLPLLLMKDGGLGDNKMLMLMMMQGGNMGAMNPLLMMSLLE